MLKSGITVLFFTLLASKANCGEPLPTSPPNLVPAETTEPLPGTASLTNEGDLSRELVDANDRFLDVQLKETRELRKKLRIGEFDPEERSRKLRELLGYDEISPYDLDRSEQYDPGDEGIVFPSGKDNPFARFDLGNNKGTIEIHRISWAVLDGIKGRGFLVEPEEPWTQVIAIPDATQDPTHLFLPQTIDSAGPRTSAYALQLAKAGARVFIPTRIRRFDTQYTLTDREWLARPAYELGSTLIAYELHKLSSLQAAKWNNSAAPMPWNIIGWGDGGMLALYAGATLRKEPFQNVCVSGYFGSRELLWEEPFAHQIFGLLREFGDAEIAALISPQLLVIEDSNGPDFRYRTREGSRKLDYQTAYTKFKGKPGRSSRNSNELVNRELKRLHETLGEQNQFRAKLLDTDGTAFSDETLLQFLLGAGKQDVQNLDSIRPAPSPEALIEELGDKGIVIAKNLSEEQKSLVEKLPNIERDEIDRHIQARLVTASAKRAGYFKKLNTKSLETFEQTIEPYREKFRTEVIGDFNIPLDKPNPRTRPLQESELTISYEVVLDVFDEVFAYGILTLPKSLPLDGSEQRPVVVCQHGLEGTPQDLVGEPKFKAYKAFATRLAERGFITFAPQNGYKYFDHFRMQQFKAQSMGKTLFSIIVPQHQQITKWLADQPFVNGEKIGFYGLSYGGKSAMRIPPLVDRYCLSICSGDFNEWVWKNAATDKASLRYSYANKGEYEIFEWNLGGTFNYAEMAWLICPRPFMVERGHFDGVAPDEKVGYEFAKIRNLYQARLGIGDRCEIEWFPGPHAINGVGTFDFLHKHLDWPKP